jgi:hypothetical protein
MPLPLAASYDPFWGYWPLQSWLERKNLPPPMLMLLDILTNIFRIGGIDGRKEEVLVLVITVKSCMHDSVFIVRVSR